MVFRHFCLLMAVAVLAGCGDSQPPVYPAKGRMTYEGQPMPLGASVTFLPINGSAGVATSGTVDEQGNLTITTFEDKSGLVAGEYRVIVYQITDKEPDTADADGEIRPDPGEDFTIVDPKDQIPKIYSDRANSPLTVTIQEGDNEVNIDLEANPAS